ncbi:tRNA lysidine(34) synthetase TilS [Cellulophaga sp. F20128]|nr:tRNA lysidine(34) synthetase TilS [Cellulophaga sp. F20128]
MLQEFKNHIKTNFPALLQGPLLLACSGGIDSVVLAHLCALSELDFALAHCNFKLRGAASDADEEFVRELAVKLDKKVYVTTFDTNAYIASNKVSLQIAARELRYQWFNNIRDQDGFLTVLTAHQADDNLETFLINLSRGTGVDGLTGIPAETNSATRPMLPFTRAQILTYATTGKIVWREDGTNAETKYLRNSIRHNIVPLLKELHPTFLKNFENTQKYLQQTAVLADNHIKQVQKELFVHKGDLVEISIPRLQQYLPTKSYIYALLKDFGFTEWEDVLGLLTAVSGKEIHSKTHRLLKDRDVLLLQTRKETPMDSYDIALEGESSKLPIRLQLTEVTAMEEISSDAIYVDKDKLVFPLQLRKKREGDVFYPFGLKGKKKLSKFFKDEKIDVISKEAQWLLCSGDKIVWVVGRRADNRFKIERTTANILKIKLLH